MVQCSIDEEAVIQKKLLWLYVPDYNLNGRMGSIPTVFHRKEGNGVMWEETPEC